MLTPSSATEEQAFAPPTAPNGGPDTGRAEPPGADDGELPAADGGAPPRS